MLLFLYFRHILPSISIASTLVLPFPPCHLASSQLTGESSSTFSDRDREERLKHYEILFYYSLNRLFMEMFWNLHNISQIKERRSNLRRAFLANLDLYILQCEADKALSSKLQGQKAKHICRKHFLSLCFDQLSLHPRSYCIPPQPGHHLGTVAKPSYTSPIQDSHFHSPDHISLGTRAQLNVQNGRYMHWHPLFYFCWVADYCFQTVQSTFSPVPSLFSPVTAETNN